MWTGLVVSRQLLVYGHGVYAHVLQRYLFPQFEWKYPPIPEWYCVPLIKDVL